MIYAMIGVASVPFHGDESTTIWMSKDFAYLVRGDWERLRHSDPPINAEEQHLRLVTGSLTKYAMGVIWSARGLTPDDINEQWHWGFGWDWNEANGHIPTDDLLIAGRLASALMLALSIPAVFALGWWAGGWPAGFIASAIYTLNPVVLLSGRRAMFEGGLLLFAALVVVLAVWLARGWLWRRALMLGVAFGLALAAKHSAFVVIGGVLVGLMWNVWQSTERRRRSILLGVALAIGAVTFWILHPVYWDNPPAQMRETVAARSDLLRGQAAAFGGYADFWEQTRGFWRHGLTAYPQYYEVDGWRDYIGAAITGYERSLWSGVRAGAPGGVLIAGLSLVGIRHLLRRDGAARPVLLGWVGAVLVGAWLLTPLDWGRYYLLAHPALGVLAACGVAHLWAGRKFFGHLFEKRQKQK